ncbi:hypothetical protein QCB45_06085 [Thiomicrorhabdus sp. ZW0627]|uniref:hypothetical protein n=1 Tax=Thiomicrorhabdus sp. ZW0627 TaxID=3039774 RepID=UPI002436BECD|nr:hypothetical protein [Thiomicrorhabdus sp. ZW0627]MDG6773894.1 hypothetical protein [Thiomicrorhabdus sp. ZW0627]
MNKTFYSTTLKALLLIGGVSLSQAASAQFWPQPESAYQDRQHSPQWIENQHPQSFTPSSPAIQGNHADGMPPSYSRYPAPQGNYMPYETAPAYGNAPHYNAQPGAYGNYPMYTPRYNGAWNNTPWNNTPWNNWRNGNWDMGNWSMPNMNMPQMNMPKMPNPNFNMPSPSFSWPNMSMPFWN